jgi:hypothetical protein
MSYDLMVFDPEAAPKDRESFMKWYWEQVEWSEPHGYGDPSVSTSNLQAWYTEIIAEFPNMNGPDVDDIDEDEEGASNFTDYSLGQSVIYAAFAWSVADRAYEVMRSLAIKHQVGFFDVSADEGEILFPE